MRRSVLSACFALCLVALGSRGALADGDANAPPSKETFARTFADSCTASAVGQGAPEATVRPLCECMGKYIVNHYTEADLEKMSSSPGGAAVLSMVKSAVGACGVATAMTKDPPGGNVTTATAKDKGQTVPADDHSFKEAYQSAFSKSCVQEAVAEGQKEGQIRPVCECTAKYLVQNYSSDVLLQNSDPTTPGAQAMLQKAVGACKPQK